MKLTINNQNNQANKELEFKIKNFEEYINKSLKDFEKRIQQK